MIVRSGLPVGVLLIASLLAAPSVFAADKFYQIIGADGRPQTVLVPEPKESAPDARAQDTDSKSTADEKAAESTPNALDKKNLTESAKKRLRQVYGDGFLSQFLLSRLRHLFQRHQKHRVIHRQVGLLTTVKPILIVK